MGNPLIECPLNFDLPQKSKADVWDVWEWYDMQDNPQQINTLLGDVSYGWGYVNFVRHANEQEKDLAPVVNPLDEQLNEHLANAGGSRSPNGSKK